MNTLESSVDLMAGRETKRPKVEQIVGSYRITDTFIGEGSTGKVMLAIRIPDGQAAAVKIINKSSRWLREDAIKEIQVLQRLNHKNIIRIDAIEEDEKYLYIFTEYLEERDVYSYMQKNGKFSEPVAFVLFKQMVAALANCHQNSVCHHDFKLENCVINRDLQLKLIDFAYSIEFDKPNSTPFYKYNGSPAYSAPEILFRKPHNESVDIFGLGACLYYMLCNCFPFCDEENTSYEELCMNVRAFCLEFPEGVSNEAKDLIRKCLAKERRISLEEVKQHPWYLRNKNLTKTM